VYTSFTGTFGAGGGTVAGVCPIGGVGGFGGVFGLLGVGGCVLTATLQLLAESPAVKLEQTSKFTRLSGPAHVSQLYIG
jgi:hypothetical protein